VLQLRPDLLKLPYSLYRVEPPSTLAADLGLCLEDRCIVTSSKELFDLFPTTDRTATEGNHSSTSSRSPYFTLTQGR